MISFLVTVSLISRPVVVILKNVVLSIHPFGVSKAAARQRNSLILLQHENRLHRYGQTVTAYSLSLILPALILSSLCCDFIHLNGLVLVAVDPPTPTRRNEPSATCHFANFTATSASACLGTFLLSETAVNFTLDLTL